MHYVDLKQLSAIYLREFSVLSLLVSFDVAPRRLLQKELNQQQLLSYEEQEHHLSLFDQLQHEYHVLVQWVIRFHRNSQPASRAPRFICSTFFVFAVFLCMRESAPQVVGENLSDL